MHRKAGNEIYFATGKWAYAEGGGRVKRQLSRDMETMGFSSRSSSGDRAAWRSVMAPDAGDNSTKKSLERTLAVICEGADGTQEVSSLHGIRGTRLTRTMASEKAQTQAAARCTRVMRRGRGIRSDSIGTPPSEESSTFPFYTRGVERELRSRTGRVCRPQKGLAPVPTLLADCVSALTVCRRRRCIHWRSAYRRGGRPAWGQKSDL